MKSAIIADLHCILFGTTYTSDPDNWELNKILAKGMLHHHGLYFKDKHEVADSDYWDTDDVEEHFFDKLCPGKTPNLTQFEYSCEKYIDWAMWESTRFVGKASKVLDGMIETIDKITSTYRVIATAERKSGLTIITPSKAA